MKNLIQHKSMFTICQDAIYLQEPGSGNESSLFAPIGKSETLFPNPASKHITLPSSVENEGVINVVNSAGSLVLSVESREANGQLDISSLNSGTYKVKIISRLDQSFNKLNPFPIVQVM